MPTEPGAGAERDVVVTGLGSVSAFGWGVEALRRGLASGRTAVARPRRFDVSGQRTEVAGEVPEGESEPTSGEPLSRADRFAVAAAEEAWRGAGLEGAERLTGVYFGSSTGGMAEGEEFMRRLLDGASTAGCLTLLASHQMNCPGDAVARRLGANGPVRTLSSACSSGAMAIGAALDALRAGEVEVAVAGGSDSLCDLTYAGFNALRAVDAEPCRPFRRERRGLSLGEGAGVLVLETAAGAYARGARPLARLLGGGSSCDAHHMTAPHPEGEGAALAMRRSLVDAGAGPEAVSFVNAHGTGTPHNDRSENRAVHAVFGERGGRIPVTSVKGAIGHLLGSAGAIEAVATVLALSERSVAPTAGEGELDPELDLDVVVGEARALDGAGLGLSTSLAFGGANAALLFGPVAGGGSA